MINRYSSRNKKIGFSFLNRKLTDAVSYDRIAGYFSSSVFEISGEAIEQMAGDVRMVCNSDLSPEDVITAGAAHQAMRKEWCGTNPEEIYACAPFRLKKLYEFLKSGKLSVKVIPSHVFGLVHGKAGVITLKDGTKTAFMGSVNETRAGWRLNYEIFWEDDSDEAIKWVQDEFDFFWSHPHAIYLSEFIVEDIQRISERTIIQTVEDWREKPEAAPTVIESPVYRKELGLWEHQKYFVDLAFKAHKRSCGARFVLADMVGLGKTIELALAAKLMALYGKKPILIIAPKTLLWQWQDEMKTLLDMPSAVWNGKEWVDENGIRYPVYNASGIRKCPRRVGIISQGLITANSESVAILLHMEYECVIVDEAHRVRRKNLGPGKEGHRPDPNNLLRFLLLLSKKCRSMLLATATPVQLYPIEAWDLLNVLAQANDSVLGNPYSMWRRYPERALALITEKEQIEDDSHENWDWIRNPFPPADENPRTFGRIRTQLKMRDDEFMVKPEVYEKMRGPDRSRIRRISDDHFFSTHNPFIRHIVRRTRNFLENTINPETQEPYLKPIKVRLFGETENEAIVLPPYLQEAYGYAEAFCGLLQKRVRSGGFLKTLLLKRVGSTMMAGESTAQKMLQNWTRTLDEESDAEDGSLLNDDNPEDIKNITSEEKACLARFVDTLKANKEKDPKYQLVFNLLVKEGWKEMGCIIFSQFYDSALWVAQNLSEEFARMHFPERIGLYAGGEKSGIFMNGIFEKKTKEDIKRMVQTHELKVLVGTDAASEGLNLQALSTLINLDLPWNPTRLEQRKGRIQRIGQVRDEVLIYNMRYKDSVEDRVHSLLSERLENIFSMFGQLPDVLEDVWINVALNDIRAAKQIIDAVPERHPFSLRYQENVGRINWESCTEVLDQTDKQKQLMVGW
ncbi:MAG: DEAD/DEAH box helicase family protein [Nitrospina sp.]|jgi:superfamily II DNA or RNA helicase|nr:DEAD/DEAH box helicase family protein [Nitrospina sp.]